MLLMLATTTTHFHACVCLWIKKENERHRVRTIEVLANLYIGLIRVRAKSGEREARG